MHGAPTMHSAQSMHNMQNAHSMQTAHGVQSAGPSLSTGLGLEAIHEDMLPLWGFPGDALPAMPLQPPQQGMQSPQHSMQPPSEPPLPTLSTPPPPPGFDTAEDAQQSFLHQFLLPSLRKAEECKQRMRAQENISCFLEETQV